MMATVPLRQADPFAFECFMSELRLHAKYCESSECPALARKIRKNLARAKVTRSCGCQQKNCHTYYFAHDAAGEVRTLVLERYSGWDSFLVDHIDGHPVSVEILTDEC
jgi:hypothetical protein